jgi:hypothetical protein
MKTQLVDACHLEVGDWIFDRVQRHSGALFSVTEIREGRLGLFCEGAPVMVVNDNSPTAPRKCYLRHDAVEILARDA